MTNPDTPRSPSFSALVLLCLLSGAFPAALPAKQAAPRPAPGAFARIHFGTSGSHSQWVRIDFPRQAVGRTRFARVELTAGTPLPARPVTFLGRLVGIEARLPRAVLWTAYKARKRSGETPFVGTVLLFEKRPGPAPGTPTAAPEPVSLTRALTRLPTRPFTPEEMNRALALRTHFPFTLNVPEFSAKLPYSRWASPPKRYHALLHWAAELRIERKTTARFGADLPEAAWFFYLDDHCVAAWKTGKPWSRGGRLSPPQTLEPGFHRLDYFVLQGAGEKIPEPLWLPEGADRPAKIPANELFAVKRPETLRYEVRGEPVAPGIERVSAACWLFAQTNTRLLAIAFRNRSLRNPREHPAPVPAILAWGNAAAPLQAATPVLFAGGFRPPLTITPQLPGKAPPRMSLPGAWISAANPLSAAPEIHIETAPLVVDPDAAAPQIRWRIRHFPQTLYSALPSFRLVCRPEPAPSAPATGSPVEAPPRRAKDGISATLALDLPPGQTAFTCRLEFQGRPITLPDRFLVWRPTPDAAPPPQIEVRGKRCFAGGIPIIFAPLPGIGPPPCRIAAGPVVFADDFLAIASGPHAELDPGKWLEARLQTPVVHIPVGRGRPNCAGARPAAAKFAALHEALQRPGRIVVWAVGAADLRAGAALKTLKRHLLLLVQATRAMHCRPVLVTLPPMPGIPPDQAHDAALEVKRLAVKLDVAVAPAYSQALLDAPGPGALAATFSTRSNGRDIGLATPNDAGRIWFLERIAQTLIHLRTPPPSRAAP